MSSLKNSNPRYISFYVLNNYFLKKTTLKDEIDRSFSKSNLKIIDRRFAYEIIKGTVRFYLKIDYLISLFSSRPVDKIDFKLLNLLRSAVYQFLYMNRVPAHAIVNETVSIAKKHTGKSSGGFVNAILRHISQISSLSGFTDTQISKNVKDAYKNTSLKYSFPLWMVKYFYRMYQPEKALKIFDFLNRESNIYIRVNRLKVTKRQLIDLFHKAGFSEGRDILSMDLTPAEKAIFSDTFILKKIYDIKELDMYKKGYFYIQDFSSQFAVKYFLTPLKGLKILDLCGAPGGKATYMSELAGGECIIESVDINPERLEVFEKNIKRLGIKNIKLIEGDARDLKMNCRIDYFDIIFIDSPCSALGTISKNPDVKYNKEIKDLKRLASISEEILSGCLKFLKPGGKIIFYTCTLSCIENQQMIKKFVKSNNKKCRLLTLKLPEELFAYIDGKNNPSNSHKNYYFEIMPYYFSSEGGFISVIEKIC